MSYGHNLSNIPLEDFKRILNSNYLIPSMRVLLVDINRVFNLLAEQNIVTVEDLYKSTKTKKKALDLSDETGIDMDYMIVLRRMVSSYIPKPRKLAEYPDFDEKLLERFKGLELKTSKDLYEFCFDLSKVEISTRLEIDLNDVETLLALMDVTRLRYVSPLFATVLVRSGFDSIEKIAQSDKKELYQAIMTTNEREKIYRGNIGDNDTQFLIDDGIMFLKYCK